MIPDPNFDALRIWHCAVEAVQPSQLFPKKIRVDRQCLSVEDTQIKLQQPERIIVVGAGKAAAAMAEAADRSLVSPLLDQFPNASVIGWVNCPADAIAGIKVRPGIHLHAARPSGINEPTEQAVAGTEKILELVGNATGSDIAVCLLSGGGSALLCAPVEGITLADKQLVTRKLSLAGANITELNTVRKTLSRVKAGGLARACRAGLLVTLILSDVLGDDLTTIASGPTVPSSPPDPGRALQILARFGLVEDPELARVVAYLRQTTPPHSQRLETTVHNLIIGNNADAVDAAGAKAAHLGYEYLMQAATAAEGDVHHVARQAARILLDMLARTSPNCWISGGEPTVSIPPEVPNPHGGRNQHLALCIMHELAAAGWPERFKNRKLTVVCGGTDGEDGPTDAAGAWFDNQTYYRSQELGLSIEQFKQTFRSYEFFAACGSLIKTGPTGTNVCDVRVATIE